MRSLRAILLMPFLCCSGAHAQGFCGAWIAAPEGYGASDVWISKTLTLPSRPCTAHVEVMTAGRYDLYVNQYNVSRSVLMPYRSDADSGSVCVQSHDITPYLRRGDNTLALWHAPGRDGHNAAMMSVCCWGIDASGRPFTIWSDGSWLCRAANVRGRTIDATACVDGWNSDVDDVALWQCAVPVNGQSFRGFARRSYGGSRVVSVCRPVWQNETADSIVAGFGRTVRGILRITLRGASRGERISACGITYVCSGMQDEQMCSRFTETVTDSVVITGDRMFSPDQITAIEMLETAPQTEP